jgi:DNA-binding transcriptional LysR family regulator
MTDIYRQKIRQLDFTLLLILQGLLRHRRTVDVAAELGLSQPAISHALRRLREIFGDPLFMRRPHGLDPTQHALLLAPIIDALIRDVSEALNTAVHFDPMTTTRNFRVGAPEHLSALVAAPLVRLFEREAPHARFTLLPMIGDDALQAVQHDQLDLALGQFRQRDVGLTREVLYLDEYALVLRRAHPQVQRSLTRKDLAKLSYIVVSPTGAQSILTDEEFRSQGVSRRIVATVSRFQNAFEVVRSTNTAVVAPRRLADAYTKPYRLAVFELPIKLRRIHIQMMQRSNPDPGLDWLTGLIRAVLA